MKLAVSVPSGCGARATSLFVVERQSGRRGLHRREHVHAHLGAAQHRDVAAVLDLLRLEAGVGREAVLELEALHVRHLDDLHREDAADCTPSASTK